MALSEYVVPVVAAVLNSLWQAVAIAGLVWIVLRLVARFDVRVNAATRFAIWWAALAVVVLLPLAPRIGNALREWARPEPVAVARPAARTEPGPTTTGQAPVVVVLGAQQAPRWPLGVFAVWAAILLWRVGQIVRSYFYLRGVKRRAFVSGRATPSIRRPARLLLSRAVSSPMALGFLRPAVIIPESLPDELSDAELEHVLLHETAHIARRDDWTNLAGRLAGAALALHPVAVWILRQIDREREMACDDWVVARTGAARPYAASLVRMFELRKARRGEGQDFGLASGIFGGGSRAGERIESLLRRGRGFSGRCSAARVFAGVGVLLGLAGAGGFVPLWIAFAQNAEEPAFEVASVKPNTSGNGQVGYMLADPPHAPEFATTNGSLKRVMQMAYQVKDSQIVGGPGWIDSDRYDITAKSPGVSPGPERSRLMVQSLLKSRFRLAVHREMRKIPVYEMVPAASGLKLAKGDASHCANPEVAAPAPPPGQLPPSPCWGFVSGPGFLTSASTTTADLADVLGNMLSRPVLDKTGYVGSFAVRLEFSPEGIGGLSPESDDSATPKPSLFTLIQEQLGLKLESRNDAAEVIVIDRVEKPDAN